MTIEVTRPLLKDTTKTKYIKSGYRSEPQVLDSPSLLNLLIPQHRASAGVLNSTGTTSELHPQ